MKLNQREKYLWLMVGIAVPAMLVFNFIYNNADRLKGVAVDGSDLEEARRLVRSEANLVARQKAVNEALAKVETAFLDSSDPELAKIQLLQEVETLTATIGLAVEQKNLLQLETNVIGVTLEGTTKPATLIRFLHGTATNRLGMSLKRLQLHTNQKTKEIKYQIIIQLLLVDKKAGQ